MPAAYRIDRERSLVLSRAWGTLTDDDIRRHYDRLRTDPGFHPDMRQLVDLREVTAVEVNARYIRESAQRSPFRTGVRRAYVATSGVAFGIARMLEAYTDPGGGEVEVFQDIAVAEGWLAAPPEP